MTNYHSVINTAKNGKLIRAEIREYVLGMALYYGFHKNKEYAKTLYPKDEHRVKQCTFLVLSDDHVPQGLIWHYAGPACFSIHRYIVTTIRSYFKIARETPLGIIFYDTKKFRIYYKRLVWGPEKRITLKHSIQYIWTNYLAVLFCLFGTHQTQDPYYIDISQFHMYALAKDTEETDAYIQRYLMDIVKIPCNVFDGTIYFETPEHYQKLWNIVNKEAARICQKLREGGYLDDRKKKDHARRKNKGRKTGHKSYKRSNRRSGR